MSDTPTPKRRFWQIQLSTAVVLALTAGALLGGALQYHFNLVDESVVRFRRASDSQQALAVHYINMAVFAVEAFFILLAVGILLEFLARRRSQP